MSAQPRIDSACSALQPAYVRARDPRSLLGPRTLAVFGFGDAAPASLEDPRYLRVPLEPLGPSAPYEVWTVDAPIEPWRGGELAGADGGELSFGWLELDEAGDASACAERAYRLLAAHCARSRHPHLLRVWNYLDAIVEGEGDSERYRQFCVGRALALHLPEAALPAATAIGHRRGDRRLQVYWLASSRPGIPLENPRQLPAYHYPRQYGPRAPSFARAMLSDAATPLPLLLSGTAAVVGHASLHPDSVAGQLRETFRNFDSLLGRAHALRPTMPARFGEHGLLKVYVRDRTAAAEIEAQLKAFLPTALPRLLLEGDICRRELAVEIDGFHA
jgi:chorismate lyase / 3-hydroxybenzoate synthase